MFKKTAICILALVLLLTTPMSITVAKAAQLEMTPRNLLSVKADLTKDGSELLMYVRFLYITAESTYFNVALQQFSNGEWTTWSSYSDIRSEQAFVFEKKVSPPKGYTYRLKVVGSSPSFPGFEFYSGELYY